ncbi:MAG: phage tail sheath C-terminal domain-containing protein [Filifactoraceae bacterium]
MALGGGRWQTQNKVLPGFYNRFISGGKLSADLSERGYAAMPISLDWGKDDAVFTVEQADFYNKSMDIFGYDVTHEKMRPFRELFRHLKTGFLYKLNTGGSKASCDYAEARYTGVRGNDIKVVIATNINDTTKFDVSTYIETDLVDKQIAVTVGTIKDNDFVIWKRGSTFATTAGVNLTGGTNGIVNGSSYQMALNKLENYSFNILACVATDEITKNLFAQYTRRMNDEVGANFQLVGHKISANSEYVISVENNSGPNLVPWVTGIEASCPINKSRTNMKYDGEYEIETNFTQQQLQDKILEGKFIFHSVSKDIRVLTDINTFTDFNTEKTHDFKLNQVIRVLQQTSNDDARIFNQFFLGKEQNNENGRAALKSMLIDQRKKMQALNAIENFDEDDIIVKQGETKGAVVVEGKITPVGAMVIMYSTTIVF